MSRVQPCTYTLPSTRVFENERCHSKAEGPPRYFGQQVVNQSPGSPLRSQVKECETIEHDKKKTRQTKTTRARTRTPRRHAHSPVALGLKTPPSWSKYARARQTTLGRCAAKMEKTLPYQLLAAPENVLDDYTDPGAHEGEQGDPDERPHVALPPPAATGHLCFWADRQTQGGGGEPSQGVGWEDRTAFAWRG